VCINPYTPPAAGRGSGRNGIRHTGTDFEGKQGRQRNAPKRKAVGAKHDEVGEAHGGTLDKRRLHASLVRTRTRKWSPNRSSTNHTVALLSHLARRIQENAVASNSVLLATKRLHSLGAGQQLLGEGAGLGIPAAEEQ